MSLTRLCGLACVAGVLALYADPPSRYASSAFSRWYRYLDDHVHRRQQTAVAFAVDFFDPALVG